MTKRKQAKRKEPVKFNGNRSVMIVEGYEPRIGSQNIYDEYNTPVMKVSGVTLDSSNRYIEPEIDSHGRITNGKHFMVHDDDFPYENAGLEDRFVPAAVYELLRWNQKTGQAVGSRSTNKDLCRAVEIAFEEKRIDLNC